MTVDNFQSNFAFEESRELELEWRCGVERGLVMFWDGKCCSMFAFWGQWSAEGKVTHVRDSL